MKYKLTIFFNLLDNMKMVTFLFATSLAIYTIFLTASVGITAEGFLIAMVIMVLYMLSFSIVNNYVFLSAMLFGPVLALIPSTRNVNSAFIAVLIWLVVTIILNIYFYITKSTDKIFVEKIALGFIFAITLTISVTGVVSFTWIMILAPILIFFFFNCIIITTVILFANLKVHALIRHYSPALICIIVIFIVSIIGNKIENLRGLLRPGTLIISFECLVIIFCRIISPISAKLINPKYIFFNMESLYEVFGVFFGKHLGNVIFKFIYGEDFDKIKPRYTIIILGTICALIIGTLISLGFSMNDILNKTIIYDSSYVFILLFSAVISSLQFFINIMELLDKKHYSNGLTEEKAAETCTVLSGNYFVMLIPIFVANLDFFKNVGVFIGSLIIFYLLLITFNISMGLKNDLKEKEYNQLKYTRYFAYFILNVICFASLVFTFFCKYNWIISEAPYFTKACIFLFIINFMCTGMGRLIAYDTYYASKKNKHFAILSTGLFISVLLGLAVLTKYNPFVFLLLINKYMFLYIIEDKNLAFSIFVFSSLIIAAQIGTNSINALMPSSTDSNEKILNFFLSQILTKKELKKM